MNRFYFSPFSHTERRWLLARMGDGTQNAVLFFLVPCLGQEIFACFAQKSFFSVWCAVCGIVLLVFYLTCLYFLECRDTPAVRRVGFILCSAVGSAGFLAGLTALLAVPFYRNAQSAAHAGRLFLLFSAGLLFSSRAGGWCCSRLMPARTKRLCAAGRWAEAFGCLLAAVPGLLLWLPSSDLPARFSLAFTLTALWRIISAAPLCCHTVQTSGHPIVLGRISLRSMQEHRYARSLACVCLLAGAGLGSAVPMLLGMGQAVLKSPYEAVRFLLWMTAGRLFLLPICLLLRRWRLSASCAALGLCCIFFALLSIYPRPVSFCAAALLILLLSDPVQRLCGRLFSAAFCLRQHAVWQAAAHRLCLVGQIIGLLTASLASFWGGAVMSAVCCELFCGVGCTLLIAPARRVGNALETAQLVSE